MEQQQANAINQNLQNIANQQRRQTEVLEKIAASLEKIAHAAQVR
jgi:hypothetical protein